MNKTGISYLDFTWNPVTGCTFGCPECWARDVAKNRLAPAWEQKAIKSGAVIVGGSDFDKFSAYKTFTPTLHPERLNQPAKRRKPAAIGVCFMGDLFDPSSERVEVLYHALKAPQHTYIFLTKRPDEMREYMIKMQVLSDSDAVPNWYLGFSARNQAEFDAGWPHMAKLAGAGWKVWVSLEPMQEWIDIDTCNPCEATSPKECQEGVCVAAANNLSGVILGAQSGKNPVTLNLDWARSVRDQCAAAGIPFMFKQDNSTGKVVVLPELDGVQHKALAWKVQG